MIKTTSDTLLRTIASYAHSDIKPSELAYNTARLCLKDSIACALMALEHSACTRHLGPTIPGTIVPNGARVLTTNVELDPIKAAWDTGALIRWLDFNDTWLAKEWGHPSDNLGSILALADFCSRQKDSEVDNYCVKNILEWMIKAYEIQGIIALNYSLNSQGLDHVLLVKVASSAISSVILGSNEEQTFNTLTHAFADGGTLRAYRHEPNTNSRKSWAAGDAASRGVMLALLCHRGEGGLPFILNTPKWGFNDACINGEKINLKESLGHYVMENILFKVSFPAEFHAQTAVECAIILHAQIKNRLNEIEKIEISTQESAIRIIDKKGVLNNPADRDHCLQYMVAIGLLEGNLTAQHYSDDYHQNHPEIDQLRAKMILTEDASYTKDYLDPKKRSIANAVQIFFKRGDSTTKIEVCYPLGHKKRRQESLPALENKFKKSLNLHYSQKKTEEILTKFNNKKNLDQTKAYGLIDLLHKE